jgi:zinc transport system substrate-binding protein
MTPPEKWKLIAVVVVVLGLVGAAVVYYAVTAPSGPPGKPSVVASFYPYEFFSGRVAGDHADASSLVPPGIEPHEWEPSPKEIEKVSLAAAFVYNGWGFEEYLDALFAELPADRPVRVNASVGLSTIPGEGEHPIDPHLWLDPVRMQTAVDNIAAGLAKADAAGKGVFDSNAAKLKGDLAALHAKIEAGLKDCKLRVIVTQHEAFGYFNDRYGIEGHAIHGLSPDQEPTPAEMEEILRVINETGVKYILYEELVDPKVAKTLADEAGVQTMVLSPVEGLTEDGRQRGDTYFTLMETNIQNLRTAMECT